MDRDNIVLEVKDLEIEYHSAGEVVHAVNGVSFTLEKGETLGLVGETGAGKTTIALSLLRLLPERVGRMTGGTIHFQGKDIMDLSTQQMRAIRGDMISMIFQDPMSALNPVLTVGDQIREAIKLHNNEGLDKAAIEKKVEQTLELVGIPGVRKNDYPMQFSGGMKQRVVIAIALACSPVLLIADEPTTALDVTIQAQVLQLMNELKRELGTSVIMITHDLGVVAHTCSKVAVMYAGKIVEHGSVYDIFDSSKPHHPYTLGLFAAIPDVESEQERLLEIPGMMPNPTDLPRGCAFAPRCSGKCELCESTQPEPVQLEGTHSICCHRLSKGGVSNG